MAFGEQAKVVRPLTLKNRDSFHRAEPAAKAIWDRDGDVRALPPDEHHRQSRWCVELNGALQKIRGVELIPSYEEPGVTMAIMVSCPSLGENPRWTNIPRSTLYASFHSARRSSALRITRTKSLLSPRLSSPNHHKNRCAPRFCTIFSYHHVYSPRTLTLIYSE